MHLLFVCLTFIAASNRIQCQSLQSAFIYLCGLAGEEERYESIKGRSRLETIGLVDRVVYEVSTDYPPVGDYIGFLELTETVWDKFSNTFLVPDANNIFDGKMQSSMFVIACDPEVALNNPEECEALQSILDGIVENSRQLTLRFIFHKSNPLVDLYERKYINQSQQGYYVEVGTSPGMDQMQPFDKFPKLSHNIWPDAWNDNSRPDLGVCAYWQKKRTFVYVINGRDDSENAVLYTRSLTDIVQNKTWTKTEIPDTKGKVFTSLFYWIFDGHIMAQITDRGQPKRMAKVYDYIPERNSFVKKYDSARQLWKCPELDDESDSTFLVLLIIAANMMFFTIIVAAICFGYAIYSKKNKKRSKHPKILLKKTH